METIVNYLTRAFLFCGGAALLIGAGGALKGVEAKSGFAVAAIEAVAMETTAR